MLDRLLLLLRILGIAAALVFLGYFIATNCMPSEEVGTPSAPASSPFLVHDLSIKPAQVQRGETVTITVTVTNTHDSWGLYSLVLMINGLREAEKQATVGAGSSQEVSFSVVREEPGNYAVFINGVSGSFSIVATLGQGSESSEYH